MQGLDSSLIYGTATIAPQSNEKESPPIVAVVVPCYNEEAVLIHTHRALRHKLCALVDSSEISAKSFICYVDDGSRDRTWEILEQLATDYLPPQSSLKSSHTRCLDLNANFMSSPPPDSSSLIPTRAIKLSRNVGHQNALLAGLDFVAQQCHCAISIDADLQDDISVFDKFIEAFKQGKEIVYGVRKKRDCDTIFKRKSAQGFYEIMAFLGVRIIYDHADYRLLSARAITALSEFKEVNLFLRGIVPLLGFSSGIVEYDRLNRYAGESKYPLRKMLSFAWNGITSFSVVPLRLVSVIGFVFFLLSIGLGGYVFFVRFFTDWAVYGWASTLIPLSFFSGVQLLSLGVIGEYIGKIYQESKARPRYFIEECI